MASKSKPKPRRTDLNYLIGWFKYDTGGDLKRARELAIQYQKKTQK